MKKKCNLYQLFRPDPNNPYKYVLVAIARTRDELLRRVKCQTHTEH